jgi:hypothetical protein
MTSDSGAPARTLRRLNAQVHRKRVPSGTSVSARAIVNMLRSASDCPFDNPTMVGFIASSTVVTPVQALLPSKASSAEFEAVRTQLKTMIAAYPIEADRA